MARKRMTQADYARHRGVARQSVHQAIAEGLVRLDGNGMIDATEADARWPSAGKPGSGTLAEARRELANVKAERERFRLEIERGDWIARREVEADAFAAGRRSRDAMLLVPARVSPLLAPLLRPGVDVAEAERIVEGEVRAAIENFALTVGLLEPTGKA